MRLMHNAVVAAHTNQDLYIVLYSLSVAYAPVPAKGVTTGGAAVTYSVAHFMLDIHVLSCMAHFDRGHLARVR